MTQPPRAPLSSELMLRLQTTVGNRAVQRLLERRMLREEMKRPKAAERHAPFWWIGGAGDLGGAAGESVRSWRGCWATAVALLFVAAIIALTVAWIRSGKM